MSVTLDIPSILKESIATVRRQQILAVPVLAIPLLALLATPLLMRLAPGNPMEDLRAMGISVTLGLILNIYAHGVITAMALEVQQKGSTSLSTALTVATRLLPRLLPVSMFLGLVHIIGFVTMIFPGMVTAFLFMYTMPAMIKRNLQPYEAITVSFQMVKESFNQSLMIFAVLITTIVVMGIVGFALLAVPFVGLLANIAASAAFLSVASVALLKVFTIMEKPLKADPAPPEE